MKPFLQRSVKAKKAECVRRAKRGELSRRHDKHDDRSDWRGFCFRSGDEQGAAGKISIYEKELPCPVGFFGDEPARDFKPEV